VQVGIQWLSSDVLDSHLRGNDRLHFPKAGPEF